MSLLRLLFSFKGRITRRQFWLGSLVPAITMGLLVFLCFTAIVGSFESSKEEGPKAFFALGRLILPLIIGVLTSVWIVAALYTKRLHDRNKGAIWLLAIYVPATLPIISLIYFHEALLLCSAIGWVSNMWVLIELGGMEGLPGPNRFDEGQSSDFLDDTFGAVPKKALIGARLKVMAHAPLAAWKQQWPPSQPPPALTPHRSHNCAPTRSPRPNSANARPPNLDAWAQHHPQAVLGARFRRVTRLTSHSSRV
jgi:uncharacterized membrane protein YhaH (DUF805 family)